MKGNIQGKGKAHPHPMIKTHGAQGHSALGNHKQRFTTTAAAKAQAPGSPKTTHSGQVASKPVPAQSSLVKDGDKDGN